jgi:hypothetical protein
MIPNASSVFQAGLCVSAFISVSAVKNYHARRPSTTHCPTSTLIESFAVRPRHPASLPKTTPPEKLSTISAPATTHHLFRQGD